MTSIVVVADPRIVKIFEITGLTNVFTIADSLQARRRVHDRGDGPAGAGDRIELDVPGAGRPHRARPPGHERASARAGFDIEELEDLRLAVGELCLLTLQGSDARHGDL